MPMSALVRAMEEAGPCSGKRSIDGREVVQWQVCWTGVKDPEELFERSPGRDWKVYFSGKGGDDVRIGWGSLQEWPCLPDCKIQGDLRLYGGLPFDERSGSTEVWGEFGQARFFLPALEWRLSPEGDQCNLILRRWKQGSPNEDLQCLLKQLRQWVLTCAPAIHGAAPQDMRIISRQALPDRKAWLDDVAAAQHYLGEKGWDKVVLSRSVDLRFSRPVGPARLLSALAQDWEESYLIAVQAPSGRVFLCRSPERVVSWCQDHIEAEAIAGTRNRKKNPSRDMAEAMVLQTSAKDRSEHESVTAFVETVLDTYCSSKDRVCDQGLIQLKYVQHIISRYQARLKSDQSPLKLLLALHPTPAVSGLPQKEAVAYLKEHEGAKRGWYAGALGWLEADKGDFAIGIRSALLWGDRLLVFAGAGIVTGSKPEMEWRETEAKMKNFTGLLVDWDGLLLEDSQGAKQSRQESCYYEKR